jgi:tetratricopeptide (TPR) repeat protein
MDKEKDIPASTLGMGTTFFIAGKLALDNLQIDQARYYFERSLSIARSRGIEQDLANNLLMLAQLAHAEGRLDEASQDAEQALKIFNKIGDVHGAEQAEACLQGLTGPWKKPALKRFQGRNQ